VQLHGTDVVYAMQQNDVVVRSFCRNWLSLPAKKPHCIAVHIYVL